MRVILVIFWVFLTLNVYGQSMVLKGKLRDQNTGAPIVFANISFLNSDKGVSSNQHGEFSVKIPKKFLEAEVHVSNLNYHDTIVKAARLQDAVLLLRPKIELLKEVLVSRVKSESVELDRPKRTIVSFHSKGLRMIAKYFPNTKRNACCNTIDKVEIFFPKRTNKKSKFRFRIFDRDSLTGLPLNDLLTVNIPVEIAATTQKMALDISKYLIEVPKNGFFIAFEKLRIPFNAYYEKPNDQKESEVFYSPILGWTKSSNFRSTSRNYIYTKGKWVELAYLNKGRARGYVPAISVTLSN